MIPLVHDRLPAIEELCRRHSVRSLALFGSAARGGFDPERSDLDFLVEFDPPPDERYADQFFGFRLALESLLGRRVDLVERDAIRNPHFRTAVEAGKAPLFES